MRQAIHIFRKDARHLWPVICLVLALTAVFAWSNPLAIDLLLFPAAGFMISWLVHAEALPGDRQFWITRPYRWRSLLGAKLLFMLAFVNLPIMLAQWWIVATGRFPLASYLPGLLFTQVLLIFCVSLPIAALAAITRGLVSFIFSVLVLLALWYAHTFTGLRTIGTMGPDSWPPGIGWVRATVVLLGLSGMVVSILYVQYRNRRTLVSRAIGVAGLALLIAIAWLLPWTAGWAVQSRLSKQTVDDSLIQISTDAAAVRFQPVRARSWANVDLDIPIAAGPLPAGLHLETDALAIMVEGGRAIWKSEIGSVRHGVDKAGRMTLDVRSKLSDDFFNQQRDKTVTIRGSLYMTAFGNPRQATIPLRAEPVNALDGLQCYLGPFDQFYCRSAFRWPGKLIYAKVGAEMSSVRSLVSYDPFPGGLVLNPIETSWSASPPRTTGDVTIVVEEPLAHIRRDFEIRDVRVVASNAPPPWRR